MMNRMLPLRLISAAACLVLIDGQSEVFRLFYRFGFQEGKIGEPNGLPSQSDIEGLMCATNEFLSESMQNYSKNGAIHIFSTEIDWGFEDWIYNGSEPEAPRNVPMIVNFTAVATTNDGSAVPSNTDLWEATKYFDYFSYIMDYLWKIQGQNYFSTARGLWYEPFILPPVTGQMQESSQCPGAPPSAETPSPSVASQIETPATPFPSTGPTTTTPTLLAMTPVPTGEQTTVAPTSIAPPGGNAQTPAPTASGTTQTPEPTEGQETTGATPETPAPSVTLQTLDPTATPQTPNPTQLQETLSPTPQTPAPSPKAQTENPTKVQETPSPSIQTSAPSSTPQTPNPTNMPETPAPTAQTLTPTATPQTPNPTNAPETSAPSPVPREDTGTETSAPTLKEQPQMAGGIFGGGQNIRPPRYPGGTPASEPGRDTTLGPDVAATEPDITSPPTEPAVAPPPPPEPVAASSPTEDTDQSGRNTVAPTTPENEMVYFNIKIDFFEGQGGEPEADEVQAMICQTNKFFQDSLRNLAKDPTLESYATNIDWEYEPSDDLPFTVWFTSHTTDAQGNMLPAADVYKYILDDADARSLIKDYIWNSEPYPTNIFYNTEDLLLGGSHNGAKKGRGIVPGKLARATCPT